MVHADWFLDSWWLLALWLPSFGFLFSFGSGRKEHRP
jgi:hypothetical protein